MSTQDAQLLLQRYLSGECTPEEKELLEAWWDELQAEYDWQIPEAQENMVHDRMLSQIRAELGTLEGAGSANDAPVRRLPWKRYAGIAAAILVILAGGWLWNAEYRIGQNTRPADDSAISIEAKPGADRALLTLGNGKIVVLDSVANGMMAIQGRKDRIMKQDGLLNYQQGNAAANDNNVLINTLAVPRGGQYKLVLADGTRVWLDAASSISFPTAFTGKTRQVDVTGQAYFEVAHNPDMPFEVRVQGQIVRDIGTAFNIYAYSDERAMKVTLASGAVRVSGPAGATVGINRPGQQAEYMDGQLQPIHGADLTAVLAWKNGLFDFTSANIATVMRQVGRWYDVDVQFDKSISDGHITGEIPRNTMLSTTLQVLRTSGVHFTAQRNAIHVMP